MSVDMSSLPDFPENVHSVQQDSTTNKCPQSSFGALKACFERLCNYIPKLYEYSQETVAAQSERYTLFIYPSTLQRRETHKANKLNMKPSHFPESLLCQTLALEHELKDKIDIKFTINFYQSPTNSIPFLLTPDGKPLVGAQMMSFLAPKSEPKADGELKLDLQSRALIHLAESALGDVLLYFYYFDPKYFESVTQPLIGAGLNQPIQYLTGYNARQEAKKVLLSRYSSVKSEDILAAASEALRILEVQLTNASELENDCAQANLKETGYFFGSKSATTLDYTIFAYVFLINTAFKKDKSHPLHLLACEFPNLRAHSYSMYKKVYESNAINK